ncbi:MAG: hypothetical protein SOI44_07730 [Lactimicrobium sp.]|uniref:hypothetical protein n=1 Tax=Lactimicrobium sp. TaxID=2563780 RepID=UPI002F350EF4
MDWVVETQGKLFDSVAVNYPDKDTKDFILSYMQSQTRKYIDESQAYVNTMDPQELWNYFLKTDHYQMKNGQALTGFLPDWIGEFYAYYQWYYNIPSAKLIKKVPIDFLIRAYPGMHDLDLELAVKKVGRL